MKNKITALVVAAVTVAALSACGHDNFKDVKNVHNVHPDYIVNVENMDRHPNIGMLCIHGAGVLTSTRGGAGAIHMVPEWDAFCRAHERGAP